MSQIQSQPAVSARCTLIKATLVPVSICSCNERQETHHSPLTSPMERAATLAPADSTRRRQMVFSMVFCHQNTPPPPPHRAGRREPTSSRPTMQLFLKPEGQRVHQVVFSTSSPLGSCSHKPQRASRVQQHVCVSLALEHLIGQSNQILAVAADLADTGGNAPAADLHSLLCAM